MGKSLQKLASCLVHLLLVQSTLPSLVQADANGSFVDQSAFSHFELWKNTGLQPCPINTTATLSAANATTTARGKVVPRDPRGRGGGGGSSSSGGGGTNGADFIKSTWVDKQESFCQKMKGTPIMIPSKPTQYAFTPWWPTFTAQFVSLVFTWLGLWWTTRTVEREGAQDMKLPILFWIQLPIDVARMLAWFVKTFHGFAVADRFSWVSVILWLVPFNYIWLVRLLDAKKRSSPPAVLHSAPQPTPYGQAVDYYKVPHVEEANTTQPASGPTRWFFVSLLFAAIAGFMWILSLVVVGLHFKYAWFDSKHTHPTYVEIAKAVSDPSLIAHGVPEACINWAKRVPNTIAWDLLDLRIVQVIQVLIVAVQFIMCTVVVVFKQGGRHHVLGKLRLSAIAGSVALVLPAIGTGFWILGTVTFGTQDEWMKYTNNLTTTGGCTFAAVAMSRKWGYWDVEYERGFRIVMSLLGAA